MTGSTPTSWPPSRPTRRDHRARRPRRRRRRAGRLRAAARGGLRLRRAPRPRRLHRWRPRQPDGRVLRPPFRPRPRGRGRRRRRWREHPVRVGQRVVLDPWLSCAARGLEACAACVVGDLAQCERFLDAGLGPGLHVGVAAGAPGAFATRFAAHASQLHVVPDGVSDAAAVLADPFSVSLHAIARTPPPPGGRVLVIGAGALGTTAVADAAALCTLTSRSRCSAATATSATRSRGSGRISRSTTSRATQPSRRSARSRAASKSTWPGTPSVRPPLRRQRIGQRGLDADRHDHGTTSFSVTGLTASTSYSFEVAAPTRRARPSPLPRAATTSRRAGRGSRRSDVHGHGGVLQPDQPGLEQRQSRATSYAVKELVNGVWTQIATTTATSYLGHRPDRQHLLQL